jgi:serine/threonine protein phosphatase PrpC
MQADATILKRVQHVYVAYSRMRLFCMLVILGGGLAFFLITGGFPPSAWRLLVQVLPQFGVLWAASGLASLVALVGLILISLTILLTWLSLLWLVWRVLADWLYERFDLRLGSYAFVSSQKKAQLAKAIPRRGGPVELFPERKGLAPGMRMRGLSEEEEWGEELDEQEEWNGEIGDPEAEDEWDEELDDREDEEGMEPGYEEEYEDETGIYEEEEYEDETGMYEEEEYEDETSEYEEEEKDEMGVQRDEDEDEVAGENAGVNKTPLLAPSLRPVRLVGTLASGSALIQGTGAQAQVDPMQHLSYSRFPPVPSSSVLPTPAVPRFNTILYEDEVPTISLPSIAPEPAARPPVIQLVVSTGLDVGFKRKGKPNEDSLLALQNTRVLRGSTCPVGFFVVADGMGGHQNGQEASRMVIQSLSKTVVPGLISGPSDDDYAELLVEGVHQANLALYQRNRQEQSDMGTTLTAALVVNTTAYIANVGDSRIYLYRVSSGLSQVTHDHSTVACLVEQGLIQPEDIYTHPQRNEIYRSLGRRPSEEIDRFTVALQPDDLLLLCSDGLWEMVRDAQIRQVIESAFEEPAQIAPALVQAALDGGGQDNISVVVVCVRPPEEQDTAWML